MPLDFSTLEKTFQDVWVLFIHWSVYGKFKSENWENYFEYVIASL